MCEQLELRHLAILLAHKRVEIERLQNIITELADRVYIAETRLRELDRQGHKTS